MSRKLQRERLTPDVFSTIARAPMIEQLESRTLLAGNPRQMEYLDRGVVATRSASSQIFISWRSLALDASGTGFNLYRSANGGAATKLNSSPLTAGTNYTDTSANLSQNNSYYVRPVVSGVEQPASNSYTLNAGAPIAPYLSIPIRKMSDYAIKHVSVGDLNGDGKYDFVVGRKPINVVNEVATQPSVIDAYLNDGTFLWSIDLGPTSYDLDNIEPGSTTIDVGNWDGVTVYDLDGDGKAEVFIRSAHGLVFGDGTTLSYPSNSNIQFMSAINGMTGAERSRIQIPTDYLSDGPLGAMMAVGYLDGEHPSLVVKMKNRIGSGEFNEMIVAYDFNGTSISQKWKWNRPAGAGYNGPYPDGHNIRVVDVDQNGTDEVVEIGYVLNGNGTVKYSLAPQIVHGDRFYVGDFDPARPGLEGYGVQQNNPSMLVEYYYDAATGQVLHTQYSSAVTDNGRGDVGDIDPNYPGMEYWSFYGLHNSNNSVHTQIGTSSPWPSFGIQWDGDLLSETVSTDHAVIDQWNYTNQSTSRVSTLYNMGSGLATADGWPIYVGDVIGDWREEVMYEKGSRDGLVIFTTNFSTTTRLYTLAQNPLYRNNMTTKGYVQTRNVDYYLGNGMSTPPTPNISVFTPANDTNIAPTVANNATSAPTMVTGTTANLSVLGADSAGESNLVYTWWLAAGNGAVTFSSNASNTAKNTVVTFTAAGNYTLSVTIRDAGGKTIVSSVNVTVAQTLSGIGILPGSASIPIGTTQQFTATALDQFNDALAASLSYNWLVIGGSGSISNSGLFTAALNSGNATILVQSGSMTGTATITIAPIGDVYQIEDGTLAGGVTIDTNNNGYTGTGFANYPGNGGSVTFSNIEGGAGGASSIIFRYALATGTRTGRLTVNGVQQNVTFTSTGSWSAWSTIAVPVNLSAGTTNTIKLESTGSDLGNVDQFTVNRGAGINNPPTVASAPGAAPNTPTGPMTNLFVLGADDGGESNLTYTWSVAGPGPVTFSSNGSLASKNTFAYFTTAGVYTFAVQITDANGRNTNSFVTVNVAAGAVNLNGTNGADTYRVRASGVNNEIYINEFLTHTLNRSLMTNLIFSTQDGIDTLVIDYSNGDPTPTGGINFVGGGAVDTLEVRGTGALDQFALNTDGSITHTLKTSTYSGIESLKLKAGSYSVNANLNNLNLLASGAGTNVNLTKDQNLASLNLSAGAVVTSASTNSNAPALIAGDVSIDNSTLNIAPNGGLAGVSQFSSLLITGTGKLNLRNNDLVLNYAASSSPFAQTNTYLKNGLTLLGGAGTTGITSNEVDGQTISGTMLALVDNGTIGGAITSTSGFALTSPSTSIIIKYTWFGDSNLDGVVDGNDYALVDTGFGSGGLFSGWVFGDYDFDDAVDGSDYALIDTGFLSQNQVL